MKYILISIFLLCGITYTATAQNIEMAIIAVSEGTENGGSTSSSEQDLLDFLERCREYSYYINTRRVHVYDEEISILVQEIYGRLFSDASYEQKFAEMRESANRLEDEAMTEYIQTIINDFEPIWIYFYEYQLAQNNSENIEIAVSVVASQGRELSLSI